MEVPVDFARLRDYFDDLEKPTGRILVSRHQSATEAPRRKRHERSRDTYFTSRSSAGAGFGVRTERSAELNSHAAQRSYSGPTPGGNGLRRTHVGAIDAGIHHPHPRVGPEWTWGQRRD